MIPDFQHVIELYGHEFVVDVHLSEGQFIGVAKWDEMTSAIEQAPTFDLMISNLRDMLDGLSNFWLYEQLK